jgi:hypothetical protein
MYHHASLSKRFGYDWDKIVGLYELAPFINKHRSIGITIEYDTAIQPLFTDEGGNLRPGLRLQRIGAMVRKRAIRCSVYYGSRIGEKLFSQNPRHTIAAIYGKVEPGAIATVFR